MSIAKVVEVVHVGRQIRLLDHERYRNEILKALDIKSFEGRLSLENRAVNVEYGDMLREGNQNRIVERDGRQRRQIPQPIERIIICLNRDDKTHLMHPIERMQFEQPARNTALPEQNDRIVQEPFDKLIIELKHAVDHRRQHELDRLFDSLLNGLLNGSFNGLFDIRFDGLLNGLLNRSFNGLFDIRFDGLINGRLNGSFNGLRRLVTRGGKQRQRGRILSVLGHLELVLKRGIIDLLAPARAFSFLRFRIAVLICLLASPPRLLDILTLIARKQIKLRAMKIAEHVVKADTISLNVKVLRFLRPDEDRENIFHAHLLKQSEPRHDHGRVERRDQQQRSYATVVGNLLIDVRNEIQNLIAPIPVEHHKRHCHVHFELAVLGNARADPKMRRVAVDLISLFVNAEQVEHGNENEPSNAQRHTDARHLARRILSVFQRQILGEHLVTVIVEVIKRETMPVYLIRRPPLKQFVVDDLRSRMVIVTSEVVGVVERKNSSAVETLEHGIKIGFAAVDETSQLVIERLERELLFGFGTLDGEVRLLDQQRLDARKELLLRFLEHLFERLDLHFGIFGHFGGLSGLFGRLLFGQAEQMIHQRIEKQTVVRQNVLQFDIGLRRNRRVRFDLPGDRSELPTLGKKFSERHLIRAEEQLMRLTLKLLHGVEHGGIVRATCQFVESDQHHLHLVDRLLAFEIVDRCLKSCDALRCRCTL